MFLVSIYTLLAGCSCKELFVKAILKLVGVPVAKLADLQSLLEGQNFKETIRTMWSSLVEPKQETIEWAKIIRSASTNGSDYMVEIALTLCHQVTNPILVEGDEEKVSQGSYMMYPSINIIESIYGILGVRRKLAIIEKIS